jgi:hypothetical protein
MRTSGRDRRFPLRRRNSRGVHLSEQTSQVEYFIWPGHRYPSITGTEATMDMHAEAQIRRLAGALLLCAPSFLAAQSSLTHQQALRVVEGCWRTLRRSTRVTRLPCMTRPGVPWPFCGWTATPLASACSRHRRQWRLRTGISRPPTWPTQSGKLRDSRRRRMSSPSRAAFPYSRRTASRFSARSACRAKAQPMTSRAPRRVSRPPACSRDGNDRQSD